jgi:hypothetical protein
MRCSAQPWAQLVPLGPRVRLGLLAVLRAPLAHRVARARRVLTVHRDQLGASASPVPRDPRVRLEASDRPAASEARGQRAAPAQRVRAEPRAYRVTRASLGPRASLVRRARSVRKAARVRQVQREPLALALVLRVALESRGQLDPRAKRASPDPRERRVSPAPRDPLARLVPPVRPERPALKAALALRAPRDRPASASLCSQRPA